MGLEPTHRHGRRDGLEQRQLAVVDGMVLVALRADKSIGGGEELDVLSVALDGGGKLGRGEDLVEGIADVLEFAVELLAVVIEPVLQAFQEVGRKVGAITGGITMRGDHRQAIGEEPAVTRGRTAQPTPFQPAGRPRQGVEQHSAVAVEVAHGVAGIKPTPHFLEQLPDRAVDLRQSGGALMGLHERGGQLGRARASHGRASRAN